MSTSTQARPVELKPGACVTFKENDGSTGVGTINGAPWVYWTGEAVQARVPVFCDADGRTLDVAGHNITGAA